MSKSYFTLDEANQMLPFVTEQIEILRTLKDNLQREVTEYEKQGLDIQNMSTKHNPSEFEKKAYVHLERLADEIHDIIFELTSRGIILKDIEKGLVDFYCQLGGEEVFLCWKYGEKEIEFYHGLQEGYDSRQSVLQRRILESVTQLH